jgi:single-strand DNA-binding protein
MKGINKVILMGTLGKEPDIRKTQSNDSVASVSIATNEIYKDKSGKQQTQTEWHKVVFFGRLAEIVEQYIKKGSKVYIEGKLRTRKWQDKNNQDRYTTEIVASEMQMLDNKESVDVPASVEQNPLISVDAFEDDNIPF